MKVGEPTKWGSYQRLDYYPSGNLILKAHVVQFWQIRREWSDGKTARLEEKLGEIIADLEGVVPVIVAARAADDARRRRWQREALERRRAEAVMVLLRNRAAKVARLAADYQRATQIRLLITAIEENAHAPAAARRLGRWARRYADHLDPLIEFRIPELGSETRRTTHDSPPE